MELKEEEEDVPLRIFFFFYVHSPHPQQQPPAHTRICRAHVHNRDYWYITRGWKNNGPLFSFSTSAQLLFLFWGVLKGEADISLVTISLSLV